MNIGGPKIPEQNKNERNNIIKQNNIRESAAATISNDMGDFESKSNNK